MGRDNESLREQREDETRLKELYLASHRGGWTWQATGALFGFVGGIVAPLLGALLLAGAWVMGNETNGLPLSGVGSILLLSTIPLLLIGGHCLDLLEKRNEKSGRTKTGADNKAVRRNRYARLRTTTVAVLLVLLYGMPSKTQAQQTIFNVPSSDVLDRGKVYGELDVTFKPNDGDSVGRFSSFVPRVVVGTGGRVEIGLNLTGNINPGDDSTTLVPAIKFKAYDGGDNGWSIVVGDNVFIPVRNKSYDVGNYVYAQVSKTFKSKTRLTAGGYHFSDNVVAASQRAGGQFGFEQPVTDKFGVAADWYTGKHAAGYFTPGINFKPHPKVTGYVGYSIGNTGASEGNHFVYTAIGINFN